MIQRLVDTAEERAALSPTALCGLSFGVENAPTGDARAKLCLAFVPRIPQAFTFDLFAGSLPPTRHHITGATLLVGTTDSTSLHNRRGRIFLDEVAGIDPGGISHYYIGNADL